MFGNADTKRRSKQLVREHFENLEDEEVGPEEAEGMSDGVGSELEDADAHDQDSHDYQVQYILLLKLIWCPIQSWSCSELPHVKCTLFNKTIIKRLYSVRM